MKMVCPACGAISSAEAWRTDAAARQCMKIAVRLPRSVSGGALNYISLFRAQNSKRGLAWGRALRLLGELQVLVETAHIQWKSQVARPVTSEIWGRGLEKIVSDPPRRLPLTSHNYLKAIVYELANETDRKEEVRHNKKERRGTVSRPHSNTEHSAPAKENSLVPLMSPDELRKIREKHFPRPSDKKGEKKLDNKNKLL